MAAVIDFVDENLCEKIDLTVVTDAVRYSKHHLHRMFTETVGITVHDYVRHRQLTEAAKFLCFSVKSIMEIALLAGFESQQSFVAAFTTIYKQSQGRFQKHKEFYPLQLSFALEQDTLPFKENANKIGFVEKSYIPVWMKLVRQANDDFPCLAESQYIKQLALAIEQRRALIMKNGKVLAAVFIFSYDNGSIGFLAARPSCRHQGVAGLFLEELAT